MSDEKDGGGPKQAARLSLQLIVEEAVALIDEQGIASASMRSVGRRLGVQGMSLYRYVPSREALLDLVVERIVDELFDDSEVEVAPTDGWRPYLERLAHGVRRYARAHPHAFPLVATRPPAAPWLNPPLRSLRWVEAMLAGLRHSNFSDDEVLFTYRTFNSFLLGYLLLETSAMALDDPKPGDGSFQADPNEPRADPAADAAEEAATAANADADTDPVDPADPVPGGLSPTRTTFERWHVAAAEGSEASLNPQGRLDIGRYPTVADLQDGLTEDHWESEFLSGLADLLQRIESYRT